MKKIIGLSLLGLLFASCSVTYPGIATGNVASKEGVAKKKIILGIALKPVDVSIETAAKNGGISKVATVDYQVSKSLFSTTYKTIVTGN